SRKAEAVLRLPAATRGILCRTNDLDHLVDIVDGDLETFQDVLPVQRLVQVELGTAHHHFLAVRQVVHQRVPERHNLRHELARFLVWNESQQDDAEGGLHLRVLVELVQHHARNGIALQFHHDAHAILVGLVTDFADAFQLLVAHECNDVHHELRAVHLVRDFRYHDAGATRGFLFLDYGTGAHNDSPAPGFLVVLDPLATVNEATRGEVRALDELADLRMRKIRILQQRNESAYHLTQVVRRYVGGHADRDTRRAVDDQVGKCCRKNARLLQPVIEVGGVVNGVLLDVGKKLRGDSREARFGVTIGSSR